jgi:hypothetical protein
MENHGHLVGGCYEIDVMAAHALKFQHDFGEPINGHLPPLAEVADFIVLTENAAQVAVSEKDRA